MAENNISSLKGAWLETFVQLAVHQSFSEVARITGRDQSVISRRIASLEDWLGKALVIRPEPISLTPEGKEFLLTAQEVCRLLEASRAVIEPNRRRQRVKKVAALPDTKFPPPPPTAPLSAAHIDMAFRKKRPQPR